MRDAEHTTEPTSRRAIDIVLFDYGNVIYTWDALYAIAGGVEASLWEEMRTTGVFGHYNEMADAGTPLESITAALAADYPQRPDFHAALSYYFSHFRLSLTGPVPGMGKLVDDLADQGTTLALLSNFNDALFTDNMDLCPQLARFTHMFISGELGMTKPGEEVFRHVVSTLGVQPQRILFIDDSAPNIDTAARLGFTTHLFTTAGALRMELVRYGVLSTH